MPHLCDLTVRSYALEIGSLGRLLLASDFYLPMPLVEALGRATVARHRVDLAFNILLAILAIEPNRFGVCDRRDPFEVKATYLVSIRRSRLLKHDWCRRLQGIAGRARDQNRQYRGAATATIYARGSGSLESSLRLLSKRTGVAPDAPSLTAENVDELAAEFRAIARDACDLAIVLLEAATELSILPKQDLRSR